MFRAELFGRFHDLWQIPRVQDKRAEVLIYCDATRYVERVDLVHALNRLFSAGSEMRPSASQCYAEAQREKYRRRRRAGWVPTLTEDEYVEFKILNNASLHQPAMLATGAWARLEAGAD